MSNVIDFNKFKAMCKGKIAMRLRKLENKNTGATWIEIKYDDTNGKEHTDNDAVLQLLIDHGIVDKGCVERNEISDSQIEAMKQILMDYFLTEQIN